jgi:hypothetical protein
MPDLVGTQDINGRGFFVRIPIGSPAKEQITLLFMTSSFQSGQTVDLIVYLHGFTSHADIRGYFGDPVRRPIWAGIEASMKNVVLAAPSLGGNPEFGSQLSKSASAKGNLGFPDYIDQVLQGVAELGPQVTSGRAPGTSSLPPPVSSANAPTPAPPNLGNLILVGHSAGGSPLVNIANLSHGYANNLKECWCFDGWYYGSQPWLTWLNANTAKQLRGYYIATAKTQATIDALVKSGLANVSLQPDPAPNHDTEPSRLLGGLVQSSILLS